MRDYNAAEFYMRTIRYDAAAIYYNQVIDRFPGSSSAERSLVKQIEAYVLFAENSVPSLDAQVVELLSLAAVFSLFKVLQAGVATSPSVFRSLFLWGMHTVFSNSSGR